MNIIEAAIKCSSLNFYKHSKQRLCKKKICFLKP